MSLILPDPLLPFQDQQPVTLLACAVFGEARGQVPEAKVAVGCVIRNRAALAPRYGTGIVGVILHPYAFSSFLPKDPNRNKMLNPLKCECEETWASCYGIADDVFNWRVPDPTQGATHYFDDSIPAPYWARNMVFKVKIGRLNFYRELP